MSRVPPCDLEREGFPPRHAERASGTDASGDWGDAYNTLTLLLGSGMLAGLIGNRGTGKTHLATCVGAEAITCFGYRREDRLGRRLRPAKYTTAADLFRALRPKDGIAWSEQSELEKYTGPSFLVIDEIQERGHSAFEDRSLVQIIDTRYRNRLDTLLVGNLTPKAFEEQMGSSVVSRMRECGGLIELVGADRRHRPIAPPGRRSNDP